MVSVKKYKLKRILIIIIAALFLFCAFSMLTTKLVYDGIFVRYDCGGVSVPEELSKMVAAREEKEYSSGKNTLSGQLYHSEKNETSTLIIIAPGLNACSDSYLWQIKSFLDSGFSVFSFDPTGCCRSEGSSTVGFSQELSDLEATLKYVENNGRFGYNEIVLFGHSRGGYAACCALALDFDISAVISVSGINSAMECVIGSATRYVGPLAYGNYGFLWLYQAMLFGPERLGISADEAISESDVPVLIIHGAEDDVVPAEKFSIISYKKRLTKENVHFILCSQPDANGHTNLLFDSDGTANDLLMEQINDFLISAIK